MEKGAKGRGPCEQGRQRVCSEDAKKWAAAGLRPVGTRAADAPATPPRALGPGLLLQSQGVSAQLWWALATAGSPRPQPSLAARSPAHPQRWLALGRGI